MAVIQVDPWSDPRWDAFVEAHPDAAVFHHSVYLRALSREYGEPAFGLMDTRDDGQVRGVLPLMWTRGLPVAPRAIGGRRLASLPRTPVAGPIGEWQALLARAVELAGEAQLQVKPALGVQAGPGQLTAYPWRMNYAYELPQDGSEPRFGPSKKHTSLRSALRRIEAQGVKVRLARSADDVRRWYPTALETLRPHVVPPRRLRFFLALWEELAPRDMARLVLAEGPGGELLGGNFNLQMPGGTVFYAFNGVRKSALHLRPNDLVHWHAIHAAAREGFKRYDLGEVVEGQAGLAQFKRKFSNTQQRLQRWYHPAPECPPDPGNGNDPGAVKRAIGTMWQRMPLRVTAAAGTAMYWWL